MNIPRRLAAALLPLLVMIGANGCMSLTPKSDPTRHFTLSPVAEPDTTTAAIPGLNVLIRDVDIPEYLNRSNLVLRRSTDEVQVLEFDRWAEPLEAGIARALAGNLSRLLGTSAVHTSPRHSAAVQVRVALTVDAFEPVGDRVLLAAHWELLDGEDRKLAGEAWSGAAAITERRVVAMNRALADLSGALARHIGATVSSP